MPVSLNEIMQMPNAAILAERINRALEEEHEKRRHFYEVIEEGKKMEFINGEIIFHSPAKLRHTTSVKFLTKLLDTFVLKNHLGYVGGEKMLVSLTRNDYEPDVCFFENAKSQSFSPTQMQFPAPNLAIEVLSPSTEDFDRDTKFKDYAAHGIGEYWIIDSEYETVEQYVLQDEVYDLVLKSKDGHIESLILPGFRINIRSIFEEQAHLKELERLIRN